ncbi:hypothetical protein NECAME_13126 [Necator americanus]|uniref:SXP/RAL-2 family protein Ani s 5-like cation-binding domain-containing protein n=1 Tax=Necator americanus TaxID=51031 RepID=W2SXC3_NECAM|nr:hypothetical protein NECAME_13126 [Necator americanus]ETN74198.1 hypothetical protein NECAME_13126 [Necator americanus]
MLGRFFCFGLVVLAAFAQKSKIPCGLPPFVAKLPAKQSQLLNETWANYKNGSDCEAQQKKTFEIIGTLSEAERNAVFEINREEGTLVDDQFDTTPSFIKSLSPEMKSAFDAIWMDAGTKETEKHKKLRKYAADHFNEEQKKGFNEWITEIVNARKAVEERIGKLSAKAKEVYDKIIRVREEERKLLNSITPELSKELYGLI